MQQSSNNPVLLTVAAMIAAMFMIAQHIAGKATRDALFLTYFDVSHLPKVMILGAGVSVAAVLLVSRLMARHGPARVIPPLYLMSALLLAIQWYSVDSMPRIAIIALYLHITAFNSILISGFWSVINERFDPYTAKKVISKLTAAATFGGLLGGVSANLVASASDTQAIILMLGGMHLICAAAVAFVGNGMPNVAHEEQSATNLSALKRSPTIRSMALLALLAAAAVAVLDYILKAEASAALSDQDLITFFSYFYMAVGLGTFLVQSAMGNKALRWLGLGGTMAVWPLAILATGGIALFVRSLATVTVMRAVADLSYNSFFRPGFELLYTPIAPADKRTGKIIIDVGADRSGDFVGGLIIIVVLLLPMATESILLIIALLMVSVCLTLILVLHRGYVHQLADNLHNGNLRGEALEVIDATTAHTVATTQTAIQRDQLLRDIERYRETGGSDAQSFAATTIPGKVDAVTETIIGLRSGEEARIKQVLASHMMTVELLPHAIPLLRDERVLGEVLRSVRKIASAGAGQLADALLDPRQHPLVKRRLPLVLAHSDSPLAVHGLSTCLESPDWNVRFRCAQGLETMRRRHPHLQAGEARLLHMARKEARTLPAAERPIAPGSTVDARDRGIQLIFTLFGALYDPETIALCKRALLSGDPRLRGTALEYLENLLPGRTWSLLRPILVAEHVPAIEKRSLQQLARDLFASASSLRPRKKSDDVDTETALDLDTRGTTNGSKSTDTT